VLAGLFASAGLVAVVMVQGGILGISPGAFGCLGGGVMAALFGAVDGRFSYRQQIAMVLPVVLGQFLALSYVGERPHAAVGYSLIALGLAGILPALGSASASAPAPAARETDAPASEPEAGARTLQTI
jgi:hypothetical protein